MRRPARLREGGYAILLLLVSAVPVVAFVSTTVLVMTGRLARSVETYEEEKVTALAEAGADEAYCRVTRGTPPGRSVVDWRDDRVDNDADGQIDEEDENVVAAVNDWSADAIDNDGDGETDEADESLLRIESVAARNGRSAATVLFVLVQPPPVPDPAGSIALSDSNAQVTINGNAFLLDGRGAPSPGSNCPAQAYGLAVAGNLASVVAGLRADQRPRILGKTPSPSLGLAAPAVDVNALDASLQTYDPVGMSPPSGGSPLTVNLGSRAAGDFRFVRFDGSVTLNGRGAGLLLVDGDLTLLGNFVWDGLIVCTGSFRSNGGGNQSIRGGLIVGGDLALRGNTTVSYDCARLAEARRAVGNGYSVIADYEEQRPGSKFGGGEDGSEPLPVLNFDLNLGLIRSVSGTLSSATLFTQPRVDGGGFVLRQYNTPVVQ